MSGRRAGVTKSPPTGTFTDSHRGGWTGARLHCAGVDGLILSDPSETLFCHASWMNEDDRAFGRGGTGAVGGAKNLKAIVIRAGIQKSRDLGPDAGKKVRREALDTIRN